MKNILITIAVLLTMSSVKAFADNSGAAVPANQFGNEADVNYAGAKVKVISSSGVTTTETLLCSGQCIVYGVVASSATSAGSYVVLYDTGTIGASGTPAAATQYMPPINFEASNKTYSIMFDPPVRFTKGITAVYTHTANSVSRVSLLYLEK